MDASGYPRGSVCATLPCMTTSEHETPLSRRLADDRAASGMSQRIVAAKITATTAAVSAWERGHHKPGDDYLFALAELYGADPMDYVRLRMASPTSGKAAERSRRQRAKMRGAAADRDAAANVADAVEELGPTVDRTGTRRRRRRGPRT